MKEEESSQHNKDDLLNFPIIHGEKELNCLGFGGLFLFFFSRMYWQIYSICLYRDV